MSGTIRAGALGRPALLLVMAAAAPAAAQEPAPAAADTVALSLEAAVDRAVRESEEARLARSQVDLAEAQVTSTRAQALPQINANLGYTRTFASAFDTGGGPALPDSLIFEPDTTASLAERVRYLERRVPTAALGGLGSLFGDLPFGQENAYQFTVSGSQVLYSGGRVGAALEIARDFREAAGFQLAEEIAEIELQVRTAYHRAQLASEVAEAARVALEQADEFLEQERLRLRAGQASELDVMRAEVARDNLRPQLVEATNALELALLDVKRLTDVPMSAPLVLTTPLEVPPAEELADPGLSPEVDLAQRAALAAAGEQVEIRRQQVRIARGAFLPDVSLQMNYGRQLFPASTFDFGGDWRTDWTAGLQVSIPIFTGFRRTAEVDLAQAELQQAELQLSQLRESVRLQYQQALGEKERARTAIAARQSTVAVAQRVYELTVLRYEQGLATQLEVNDARLSLLQASTNLAQAVADYYIADAGLARALAGGDAARLDDTGIPDVQPSTPTQQTPRTPLPTTGGGGDVR